MTLYVISCIDKPDSAAIRQKARESHLAYVRDTVRVTVKVGGPYLADDGAMIGSLLIVEAETPGDVAAFVRDDPYGKTGLFQSVEVRPWKVTVGRLDGPQ